MDVAYNQHADRSRRKNRSFNNLTLAPLTIKLPIETSDETPESSTAYKRPSTSYLQGRSAPTTPRLLTRSPANSSPRSRSRSHQRTGSAPGASITKSKSAAHLAPKQSRSGTSTPKRRKEETTDKSDGDWLMRAGALMTSEAREYKGQNWLVSRQSSTSLAGMPDIDEEAFEAELARERDMAGRRASRPGSVILDGDITPPGSHFHSRRHSQSQGTAFASRSRIVTPGDTHHGGDSYFASQEPISGPDFINLDSKLEELEQDTTQDDEAMVKRLVRKGQIGKGSWISNVVGWHLFSVDENEEDSDEDGEDDSEGNNTPSAGRSEWPARHFEGVSNTSNEANMPPPVTDEGVWKDAAWLLSVASKVMF